MELKVKVPAEEITGRIEANIDDVLGRVQLPGFRPGKVPRRVVIEKYGSAITTETVQEVLQEAYKQALPESGVEPLSPGEMDDIQFQKGEPLTFTVKVEVAPDVELPPLSDIAVDLPQPEVSDEDVAISIDNLRESQATLVPTEESIDEHSVVTVDVQELDASGLPLLGRSRKDLQIDLPKSVPGDPVSTKLIGLKSGQTTIVDLPARPTASGEEAKPSRMQRTVTNVQHDDLPALDDEFAKAVNPKAETLDALKADLKRYLEARAGHKAREQMFRGVVEELLKKTDFAVPPRMLERYLDDMAHNAIHGHSHDDGHHDHKHDPEQEKAFKEKYRASAIWNLRWYLLRKKLVKEFGIDVSEDEYQAELERLSAFEGVSRKEYQKKLSDEQANHIREDLLERKVLAELEKQVNIVPRPVSLAEFEGRTESKLATV